MYVILILLGLPEGPQSVTLAIINQTCVLLTWMKPNTTEDNILNYQVRCRYLLLLLVLLKSTKGLITTFDVIFSY